MNTCVGLVVYINPAVTGQPYPSVLGQGLLSVFSCLRGKWFNSRHYGDRFNVAASGNNLGGRRRCDINQGRLTQYQISRPQDIRYRLFEWLFAFWPLDYYASLKSS